ncbi:MAG: NAD(P)/FAD-dependent oxidoreductase [Candidatus Hodgkinia cicadicola]
MKTNSTEDETNETDLSDSLEANETDLLDSEEQSSSSCATAEAKDKIISAEAKDKIISAEAKDKIISAEAKDKIISAQPSQDIKFEVNVTLKPTPKVLVEKLVVIGSGLAAYSSSIVASSAQTPPLLITGPTLGGSLASSEALECWPGAAPIAKSSDLAASLHVQSALMGAKFMFDSVQSIDTSVQPYVIKTKLGNQITASAIIIATGLSPKTLNLPGEASLIGRSVFTSAASINGPHKDAAVVGHDSLAITEALALSKIVSQVTLVCDVPCLSCPPDLAYKLSQTSNIRIEYNSTVYAYGTDESTGGPFLWGLALKRSDGLFTINATVVVLALGSEPKVDLLPSEAKTADGFVKANITELNLKGIFAAGSIVESMPTQLIMISASGFTAANAALRYLSTISNPPEVLIKSKPKLAEAEVKAPASVSTSEVKADVLAKSSESTSAASNTTSQLPNPLVTSEVKSSSSERPKQVSSDNKLSSKSKNPSSSKRKVQLPQERSLGRSVVSKP